MGKKNKEIIISVDEYEIRVAILEDRKLVEYYAEEKDKRRIVGNIYLGKVKDVLPGMEAAFIDIGLDRNAFLFIDEAIALNGEESGSKRRAKIQQLVKPEQDILVQVIREPVDKKGARLTANLSLPGRKLVLMPYSKSVGISKKISEKERERLHGICSRIRPKDTGIIARTAAVGATEKELASDLDYLNKLWNSLNRRNEKSSPPSLIYNELDLANRTVRDIFNDSFSSLTVDDEIKYEDMNSLMSKTSPDLMIKFKLFKNEHRLFEDYDIEAQLESALSRKVWLRSGGYIAIDRTEALTSIDVNTAKNIGSQSLEKTIFKNNLEAVDEIVMQLRLRDIGGIIVIDFIDMQEQKHKEAVFKAFNNALESDRTKSRVIEISKLGLVEMTRKSTSKGVQAYFYEKCPTCNGTGHTVSLRRATLSVLRKITRALNEGDENEVLYCKVAPDVLGHIQTDHVQAIKNLENRFKKRIKLESDKDSSLTSLKVLRKKNGKDISERVGAEGSKNG